MSLIATVTLPDGAQAVVHSETLGWDDGPCGRDRAELVDTVLLNFAVGATYCPTIAAACPGQVVFDSGIAEWASGRRPEGFPEVALQEDDLGLWAAVRVLCQEERCRGDAEMYEQELGEVHPDAPLARAWAADQTGPATTPAEAEMA